MVSDAMIDLPERIEAMLRQERTIYMCADYMACDNDNSEQPTDGNRSSSGVCESWREKICEWSYQVVDHFDFSREVVSVSLSYLDRYLSTQANVNKKLFQLAAMTTLYLAIKLYEPGATLKMSSMIELSRGYFMVEHIDAMEKSILRALSWHMHPPTSFCIARHCLHLLPCPPRAKHEVLELSRFLTELSACYYYFVPHKASSVALASILIGMEEMYLSTKEFEDNLRNVVNLELGASDVEQCRAKLRDLYHQGGYSAQAKHATERAESISPVCVSGFTQTHPSSNYPAYKYY